MLNPLRDREHLRLGADTAGAVDVAGCRAGGLSADRIGWLVQTGRWQSPFPRVYVTFSGPIPRSTMEHAALLYAGSGSALSHASAGFHAGLCAQPASIHVIVSYSRQVADQAGLLVHRSRSLVAADVHPAWQPRRTRIERTVCDLMAARGNADAALGLVAAAVASRSTTSGRLRETFTRLEKTRWRRVVLDALPDVAAGAHSALEIRDAGMRRTHRLPMGARQFSRLAGGTEYLDVVIEQWGLHVELDGRLGHDRARDVWRDMKRDNRSELAGLRHLRYGWADMIDRPCEVAIEQAVILRQQGWPGAFRRCPSCPVDVPPGL